MHLDYPFFLVEINFDQLVAANKHFLGLIEKINDYFDQNKQK